MDEILRAFQEDQRRSRWPTDRAIAARIEQMTVEGNLHFVGMAQPSILCCKESNVADAIAVFIPKEETEVAQRQGRFANQAIPPNPEFRAIVLGVFDAHSGNHIVAMMNLDAMMELDNRINTAIRLMTERTERLPPIGA